MTQTVFVFYLYIFLGLFFILFSKMISNFIYNLALMYTDKMNLRDVFLFKIDHSNRDSFFSLARGFTIFLGILVISICIYFKFYVN